MRKALLQRLTVEAAASTDSSVSRDACAPGPSTPDTVPIDVQKCLQLAAFAKQLGLIGGERSTDDSTTAAVGSQAAEGEQRHEQDKIICSIFTATQSVAGITADRHADSTAGNFTACEARLRDGAHALHIRHVRA